MCYCGGAFSGGAPLVRCNASGGALLLRWRFLVARLWSRAGPSGGAPLAAAQQGSRIRRATKGAPQRQGKNKTQNLNKGGKEASGRHEAGIIKKRPTEARHHKGKEGGKKQKEATDKNGEAKVKEMKG